MRELRADAIQATDLQFPSGDTDVSSLINPRQPISGDRLEILAEFEIGDGVIGAGHEFGFLLRKGSGE